jgi:hypothetical protein
MVTEVLEVTIDLDSQSHFLLKASNTNRQFLNLRNEWLQNTYSTK